MDWWRRSESSSSSGYCSAATCSGGLYRNLNGVEPVPTPSRERDWSPSFYKREREFEERSSEQPVIRQKRGAAFLPCYVKPRRSIFETAEEVEVRFDCVSKREVWVRLLGFPSNTLKDALAKYEPVPPKSFERARPILVVYNEEQRKRGLLVSSDKNSVKYLDVDSGKVEGADVQQIFEPDATLLSIPNAAIRCRLEVPYDNCHPDFAANKVISSDWTRTRLRIVKWGAIPTVSLSILDPDFDLKPVIKQQRIVPRKAQKLYGTLPGILIPPAHTILRNCSVLFQEQSTAYIVPNDAPFETDPTEDLSDGHTVPPVREAEQFYLVGDVVCAQYNQIEMRVVIESVARSCIVLRSIDSGEPYEVNDFSGLKSLSKREPPRALKVALPGDYSKIPEPQLGVFLKTGVFDVFFDNGDDPPSVRIFTVYGMEINVCVCEKSELPIEGNDSEDDTSLTRSSRG